MHATRNQGRERKREREGGERERGERERERAFEPGMQLTILKQSTGI